MLNLFSSVLFNLFLQKIHIICKTFFGIIGGWMTGIVIMIAAIFAAYYTKESFANDMNFLEK